MNLLPSRIELLHPMIVHFPIALLLTGAFARLLYFFAGNKKWADHLRVIYLWSLFFGFIGLIGAFLSGDEAEGVVNKIICDPTITNDHEDYAKLTMIACGVTLSLAASQPIFQTEWFKSRVKTSSTVFLSWLHPYLKVLEVVVLVITLGLLVYSSHLGGTLVYEQGAAYLTTPNENCE